MIEKEINGITYYCFEPSEEEARKRFERAMVGEDSVANLLRIFLDAITEMERNKREAWQSVQMALPESYIKEDDTQLTYNWMVKGFVSEKKPEK